MTYRLFGRPYSGSLAVEWLLEELSLPYSRVLVTGYGDDIQPPWFRDLNPIGQVPALELPDGQVMTESGAMMLYLADAEEGAGWAPSTSDPARADYLRWMTFLAATIYPGMMRLFHPENYIDDPDQFDAVKRYANQTLPGPWSMIEVALDGTGYLAGDHMSAADLYLAMFAVWAEASFDVTSDGYPNIQRLADELCARPKVANIVARHKNGTWGA